jgi:nicotinate-nucleotide adenylyltransferase
MSWADGGDRPSAGRPGGARVAFFGGSFDPPHLGHLAVARAARAAFRLDEVLFAPVGVQPLKREGPTAGFDDRVAMTKLAIAGEKGFAISLADAPKPNGQPNFTLETLLGLRAELGAGSTLFCLMGADSFFSLRRWHRAAEVPFVAPLIVASRPGEPPGVLADELQRALPQGLKLVTANTTPQIESGVEVRAFHLTNPAGERAPFYVLPELHVEISASEIRDQLRAEQETAPGDSVLPSQVADYIRSHQLYK